MSRPFRFSVAAPRLEGSPEDWETAVRRIESAGFSSLSISDHFTGGWRMEPLVAMTAAACATTSLRVLSLVLGADYRHPVQVHRAMATLDVLSGGRVEVGLGAGWLAADYRASGLDLDAASVRIDRLREAVDVIGALFGADPVTYHGHHVHVESLDGLPKPVQRPRPPILIGGGGSRVLTLAAQQADIIGYFSGAASGPGRGCTPEGTAKAVQTVRDAAHAAGRDMESLELQLSLLAVHLTDVTPTGWRASTVPRDAAEAAWFRESPLALIGTVEECVAALQRRRDRYGFSYFNAGGPPETLAPLVERLAGQ